RPPRAATDRAGARACRAGRGPGIRRDLPRLRTQESGRQGSRTSVATRPRVQHKSFPECRDRPSRHVEAGTALELGNETDEDILVFVYRAPAQRGPADLLGRAVLSAPRTPSPRCLPHATPLGY